MGMCAGKSPRTGRRLDAARRTAAWMQAATGKGKGRSKDRGNHKRRARSSKSAAS